MSSHWSSSPQTWRRVLERHALGVVVALWTGSGTESALHECWHTLPPPLAAAWCQGHLTEQTPLIGILDQQDDQE